MSEASLCAQLPPLPSPLQDPPQTWHLWLGAPDTQGTWGGFGQGTSVSTGLPPQDLHACLPLIIRFTG